MRQLAKEENKSAMLDEAIGHGKETQLSELQKLHTSLADINSKVKTEIEAAETMILFSQEGVEFPAATRMENKWEIYEMYHANPNILSLYVHPNNLGK